jgi:cell wall assembly regulator SMI1
LATHRNILGRKCSANACSLKSWGNSVEIVEVEKVLGITLPPGLRETYLIHNGCADYFFFGEQELLSLQEVLKTWERWRNQGDWEENSWVF